MKRPPIVVVMGHVDHGKTSLLDYIRVNCAKAASPTAGEPRPVAGREAGGITQSIGAYEIGHNDQRITFIDTPGHQAFSQMRARGARVADVAILVVAVDDSVQEQTKEAIKVLEQTKTPFIVAITKIDKANIDINRVKNDLMAAKVFLEGYGGNVSWKGVSSKTGEGINDLLDLILLATEMEDLKYEPENPGRGFVLESKIDSRKGVVATVIVTDGKLKVGDEACVGSIRAKIRSLENFLGKPLKEAEPSSPVLVIGFKEVPAAGTELLVGGELAVPVRGAILKHSAEQLMKIREGKVVINLILKADSYGSLEALSTVIKNLPLPENYELNIISEGIGEITDGDVKFGPDVVIGFRVEASKAAMDLAKIQDVKIMTSEIVYELTKLLEDWLKSMGQKIISGDLEILAVFGKKGWEQIIGGKVVSGEVKNNAAFEVQRNSKEIGIGRIVNLQQQKKDVVKVEVGNECGLLVQSEVEIRVGDHLIFK